MLVKDRTRHVAGIAATVVAFSSVTLIVLRISGRSGEILNRSDRTFIGSFFDFPKSMVNPYQMVLIEKSESR
jgi:hypothetical protein